MDERDMLKKIADSAEDIKVPEALEPERIKQRLERRKIIRKRFYRTAAAAACLCLCLGAGRFAYANMHKAQQADFVQKEKKGVLAEGEAAEGKDILDKDMTGKGASEQEDSEKTAADAQAQGGNKAAPLKKIGRMYTLAGDYGEVYDAVKKAGKAEYLFNQEKQDTSGEGGTKDLDDVSAGPGAAAKESAVMNREDSSSASAAADYSGTNLQVEGVDESDIVKTDGKYIYAAAADRVQVLDVRSRTLKKAGAVRPEMNEDTDVIREMYAADQKLTLIIQTEDTAVKPVQDLQRNSSSEDAENSTADDSTAEKESAVSDVAVIDDIYRLDTDAVTKVFTYDIKDPQNPRLLAVSTQDGWYQDSRKIGNCLYLFTNESMYLEEGLTRGYAVTDIGAREWIPAVNGNTVQADCIYMQKEGRQGLLAASMDLSDSNRVLDTKLLINKQAQIYVTQHSLYIYYEEYANESEKTRIARFALEDGGVMRAEAAASVKGAVRDTFAVHETDGRLQVLTSVTSAEPWENRVYVLDEHMEVIGRLTGLAEGEMIYAARFIGDIGYFVTYRNTDPLFTVDFSDPKKPKVIGELKVTGFSDYLHFWGNDKLLGIGRETDPDTGADIGLKLSMFDISKPGSVKEEGKVVLKGIDSEALYEYKSVLVSSGKNIIGFLSESWKDGFQRNYHVFSYADGKFTSRLVRRLTSSSDGSGYTGSWRGLYIDDMLYIVCEKKAIAVDMKNGWKETAKVTYR